MAKNIRVGYDAKRAWKNLSGLGNFSRDLLRGMKGNISRVCFVPDSTSGFETSELYDGLQTPKSFWKISPALWRTFGMPIRKKEIDLFHGLSNELPFFPSKGVPYILSLHDLIFLDYPEWYGSWDRWIYQWKLKRALHNAQRIVCISSNTRDRLLHYFPQSKGKIEICYQSCHPVFWDTDSTVPHESNSAPYWIHVGTIEPRKNILRIAEMLRYFPDMELVLIGRETAYYSSFLEETKALGVQDRIRKVSCSSMEEVKYWLKGASLAFYPSIEEGFCIPILEALLCRVPVVTSNRGVFIETAGPHSWCIDIQDDTACREAIESIFRDDKEKIRRVEASLEHAQRFSPEKITEQWISIYCDVIQIHESTKQ